MSRPRELLKYLWLPFFVTGCGSSNDSGPGQPSGGGGFAGQLGGASGFGGAEDVSAYVRLAAPTTLTGYACRLQGPDQVNRTRLRRYDGGGSNSSLANDTTTTWIDGDIARCEVTGSTLTAKQNGVTVLTASDATYGSGRGGIGVLSTPGVGNENWTDDFEVGDLATTTVVRHKPLVLQ